MFQVPGGKKKHPTYIPCSHFKKMLKKGLNISLLFPLFFQHLLFHLQRVVDFFFPNWCALVPSEILTNYIGGHPRSRVFKGAMLPFLSTKNRYLVAFYSIVICILLIPSLATYYTPSKLTWHWKIPIFNRKYIFIHGGWSIVMLVFGRIDIYIYGYIYIYMLAPPPRAHLLRSKVVFFYY